MLIHENMRWCTRRKICYRSCGQNSANTHSTLSKTKSVNQLFVCSEMKWISFRLKAQHTYLNQHSSDILLCCLEYWFWVRAHTNTRVRQWGTDYPIKRPCWPCTIDQSTFAPRWQPCGHSRLLSLAQRGVEDYWLWDKGNREICRIESPNNWIKQTN